MTMVMATQGERATTAVSTQGEWARMLNPRLCSPLPTAPASRRHGTPSHGPLGDCAPHFGGAHLPAVLLSASVSGWALMRVQWGSICEPHHCL
ncbi:hypothetical protein IEO21_09760 [Rhodonia placenta]|uniref:Uncharacterized protein n=1 Tax=Rhodonia placenta TaxID=104341 RepID=A0A8H7NTQ3_9APHY|nr:hypothetical protein IEO21_09760 [Postia placenta]